MPCLKLGMTTQKFKGSTCGEIVSDVVDLRNELAKRTQELKENVLNLPKNGKMSIKGHIEQMFGKQTSLREKLLELETRRASGCCKSDEDVQRSIPQDAWQYATREAPRQNEFEAKDFSFLETAGKALGVTALVVGAVLLAPEIAASLTIARFATVVVAL